MQSVLTLLLALPLALAAHKPSVNHRELAKRAAGDLEKRGSAKWTFYSTGLGACGGHNSDSDFIVALNEQTFGYSYPSKYCNKKISMTYNGKTTTATIVDACPGCPAPYGLDLSPGLFSFFASEDAGVIYGDWHFVDGSDDDTPTTQKETPTTTHHTTTSTTHTTHTTPTSTYTPPTTTTTSTKKEETTTSSSSSSSSSSKSSASPSHSSSSSAVIIPSSSVSVNSAIASATGTVSSPTANDPENLNEFSQAFLALTGIVLAGAKPE
ncbi:RlpA-like double-psi beta-barrel-protein domain-containing protein-containing protein [Mycena albidolilacea]|uniref:RlpA-like double-psi beta-barrel-protein domain-containing protein-containing protein n=1 Tax=Mycena albidolilacea TaxID=1033008 RepID=A0AAD6ZYS4_9AGAR|nr:RlpA-like double-psi beta-barrel-protein domain-containing protein-containing protein [Mycena albidolilacea]